MISNPGLKMGVPGAVEPRSDLAGIHTHTGARPGAAVRGRIVLIYRPKLEIASVARMAAIVASACHDDSSGVTMNALNRT